MAASMAYSVGSDIGDTNPVTSATRARLIDLVPLAALALPVGAVEELELLEPAALEPAALVELLDLGELDELQAAATSTNISAPIMVAPRRCPPRTIILPSPFS
jgi:hypothetical protein